MIWGALAVGAVCGYIFRLWGEEGSNGIAGLLLETGNMLFRLGIVAFFAALILRGFSGCGHH